jgi:hypothetical protein
MKCPHPFFSDPPSIKLTSIEAKEKEFHASTMQWILICKIFLINASKVI